MIKRKENIIWHKFNGLTRYLLVHLSSDIFPFYIVNEYPKSGGTWLSQMLSKSLNVPHPRDRLPMLKSSIMHGHYLHPWNMKNVVVIWRDGRDVVVSEYFHHFFLSKERNKLKFDNYDNILKNLPYFIECLFAQKVFHRFSWSEFVDMWYGHNNVIYVKYEDLRTNPADELISIVKELTNKDIHKDKAKAIADDFSFEKQARRKAGEENKSSFLRKGIAGDWKNHFNQESRELFNHYAGSHLIRLGYEKDGSWV